MISKEILKEALAGYAGTLLLVSHDRGFLDGLTDRVYFIKDKTIKVYHEPVTQFINSYYNDINSDTKAAKKPEKKSTKLPEIRGTRMINSMVIKIPIW